MDRDKRIKELETELAAARKEIAKSDGLGLHCKELRLALADALIWILGELPSAPHEGSCGGPNSLCDQECADVANAYGEYRRLFKIKNNPPHYFESKASEARKDSERLDWLENQGEVDVWMRGCPQPDYMAVVNLTPKQWDENRVLTVDDVASKSYCGETVRAAIDAAMKEGL